MAGALQHLLSMNRGQKGMPGYPVLLEPGSHIAQKGLQKSFLTQQAFE